MKELHQEDEGVDGRKAGLIALSGWAVLCVGLIVVAVLFPIARARPPASRQSASPLESEPFSRSFRSNENEPSAMGGSAP